MNQSRPFGPPVVQTRPIVTTLRRRECAAIVDLWCGLRRDGAHPGLCLFESSGAADSHAAIRQTVLVTRAQLRLEVRSGEPVLTPLVSSGEELVSRLEAGLKYEVEDLSDRDDDTRLRANSVFDVVRRLAGSVADSDDVAGSAMAPGLFGALGYDFVDCFESLPERCNDAFEDPDLSMVLATDMVVEDIEEGVFAVITRGMPWEEAGVVVQRHADMVLRLQRVEPLQACDVPFCGPLPSAESDLSKKEFMAGVASLRDEIGKGEIFQAVLSRGITVRSEVDSADVFCALRLRNPSPYLFHIELGRGALLGASPELCLRVENGCVEIRPIAGTAARGLQDDGSVDKDLDDRLALALQLDPKEQAEHVMLLDLARNDIARVARPGTTEVVEQFAIERYSHVQHLVSRVRGRLREGLDALHAYRAAANMGTLTGAPKVRAMDLIRRAEPVGRGFYGGAAGYLLADGRLETCIVIRSIRAVNGVFRTQAGAGVVWGSDPESEYVETERKAYACREAIALAERGVR